MHDDNIKNYCNSILVKSTSMAFTLENTYNTNLNVPSNTYARCASIAYYNSLYIANVHLTGGAIDDKQYNELGKIKDYQISQVNNCDIITGDFNGNRDLSKFPSGYKFYESLSDTEKDKFKEFYSAGHKPLLLEGFKNIPINNPTDQFGGNPDHVYYNPDKLN